MSSLARFNPQGLWTRPMFTINGWSQDPEGACLVMDGEVARLLTAHHGCEVQHLARERRKGGRGGGEGGGEGRRGRVGGEGGRGGEGGWEGGGGRGEEREGGRGGGGHKVVFW